MEETKWEMEQLEHGSNRPPALDFKDLPKLGSGFSARDSDSDTEDRPLVSPHGRSRDTDLSDSETVYGSHLHDRHPHPALAQHTQHGGPFSPLPTPITNPSFAASQHRRRPSRSYRSRGSHSPSPCRTSRDSGDVLASLSSYSASSSFLDFSLVLLLDEEDQGEEDGLKERMGSRVGDIVLLIALG